MNTNRVDTIEGIGPVYRGKLAAIGINTTDDLLERCGSAFGRQTIAASTGLRANQLLKWVNMADLMRLSGVGGEYSHLLEAAGVDTVKELKARVPEHLHEKLASVNEMKKLARRTPALHDVSRWVAAAQMMEARVFH
jgi:predicted flap endonuclease-1-like 5' DNA nuclease